MKIKKKIINLDGFAIGIFVDFKKKVIEIILFKIVMIIDWGEL